MALVLIISWLPLPEDSQATGAVWIFDLWAENSQNIIAVVIGLVFSIMYWIRSNTLMTALDDQIDLARKVITFGLDNAR